MCDFVRILLATATALSMVGQAQAGFILFDQTTDTISVAGQTVIGTAATYEAQVLFTAAFSGNGSAFNEWQSGSEDKQLNLGPTNNSGFNYNVNGGIDAALNSVFPLSLGVVHHVAFVYDGSEQRLYLDGQLQASQPASGDVLDSSGVAFIGANSAATPSVPVSSATSTPSASRTPRATAVPPSRRRSATSEATRTRYCCTPSTKPRAARQRPISAATAGPGRWALALPARPRQPSSLPTLLVLRLPPVRLFWAQALLVCSPTVGVEGEVI